MSIVEIEIEQKLRANIFNAVEQMAQLKPEAFILRGNHWGDTTCITAVTQAVLPGGVYDLSIEYHNKPNSDQKEVWLRETGSTKWDTGTAYCLRSETPAEFDPIVLEKGRATDPEIIEYLLKMYPPGVAHFSLIDNYTTIDDEQAQLLFNQVVEIRQPGPGITLKQFREAQSAQQNSRPKLT